MPSVVGERFADFAAFLEGPAERIHLRAVISSGLGEGGGIDQVQPVLHVERALDGLRASWHTRRH